MKIGTDSPENVAALLATPYPFMAWLAAHPDDATVAYDVTDGHRCPLHAFLVDCFGPGDGRD